MGIVFFHYSLNIETLDTLVELMELRLMKSLIGIELITTLTVITTRVNGEIIEIPVTCRLTTTENHNISLCPFEF